LHVGHANVQINLLLRQQALLHIALDTTEQEGSQNTVKLLDDCILILFLAREPLVKSLCITKNIWKQEVEQGPKFVKVVL
jgi:hypothetical protein